MTEPRTPDPAAEPAADPAAVAPAGARAPADDRADPLAPGPVRAADRPVTSEAEREVVETVRSISRLEESN